MLKRLLCMSTAALLMVNAPMAAAAMEGTSTYVSVTGYDANVDYTAQIYECLKDKGLKSIKDWWCHHE